MKTDRAGPDAATLRAWVQDSRQRTLDLLVDLTDEQLLGPKLRIVNPPLWEIGHLGWFQEKWVLRHALGRALLRSDADRLYDSAAVAHDTRWDLPLPSRSATLDFLAAVQAAVLDVLAAEPSPEIAYFVQLAVFHEDMHGEAFLYTRQTHAYPPPPFLATRPPEPLLKAGPWAGDVAIPGGTFFLGATPDEPFVFDNEKWAHPHEVRPFRIAKAPVTQAEFANFVEAGGYTQERFWSPAGWAWRQSMKAEHPVYWQRAAGGGWRRRDFDRWLSLEPHRPVIHVNAYEAEAYCRWANRRLPSELEWEVAAAALPDGPHLATRKPRFPWGDELPVPSQANLGAQATGCADVAAFATGDSAWGVRQLIGNVWEWTADAFEPYPGFVPDPYKEYSQPWFGDHRVLRGGCWVTQPRLLRNTWRNFYTPDRRDVWAGFRTCALDIGS